MKLSFVIPAHNEEGYIGRCLDSIFKELRGTNYDVEVVVVNNASTDRTRKIATSYGDVKIVDEPHKGIVWARRAGFLASTGDLIANVDADTMLTPGWIKKVFDEFLKNPKLVALSGPFIYYDLPKTILVLVKIFYYFGFVTDFVLRLLKSGAILQGGNFVLRRTALEAIGGYNTRIEFYGEDTDIALRISEVGQVKFTYNFPIYTSGRRLAKEGLFTIGIRYGANNLSMLFFKKPLTKTSLDIRTAGQAGTLKINPLNKIREWTIASLTIIILCSIIFGSGFFVYRFAESLRSGFIATTIIPQIRAETQKLGEKINTLSTRLKDKIKNATDQ